MESQSRRLSVKYRRRHNQRDGWYEQEKHYHFDTIGSTRSTNAGTRITHTRAQLLRAHAQCSGAQITEVGKMLFLCHLIFRENRLRKSKIKFQIKVESLLYKLSFFGLTMYKVQRPPTVVVNGEVFDWSVCDWQFSFFLLPDSFLFHLPALL